MSHTPAQERARAEATAKSPWHNRSKKVAFIPLDPPDPRLFCGHCVTKLDTHDGEYIEHVKECLEAHRAELYAKNWVSRPDKTYPYPRLINRESPDGYQQAQDRNGYIRELVGGLGKLEPQRPSRAKGAKS